MLRDVVKYTFILMLTVYVFGTQAWAYAEQVPADSPQGQEAAVARKPIVKVKPPVPAPPVLKVRPTPGPLPEVSGLSRFNPLAWGPECFLPMPAKGQFVATPRVTFARISGEICRPGAGVVNWGLPPVVVNFDDQLGLSKNGIAIGSITGQYQVTPRVGFRYTFSPMSLEGTQNTNISFTFVNRSIPAGAQLRTKWDRAEHRAGLTFSVARTENSDTTFFAEWLYIQDKISIAETYLSGIPGAVWDHDKSVAVLGLEINKCIKNFGPNNTLALSCRGGIAFLDDHAGYDAEAALSYMMQFKPGRYGFIKGGYRYAMLKKDKDRHQELFKTTMDGAFINIGVVF